MEALYAEHREQAIQEFTNERLQSYYLSFPSVAEPPFRSLDEARQLLPEYPTAAFIFAVIATEVGLKAALLKPIVYGLVHSDSAAGIITDMVIANKGYEKFRDLLFQILNEYGGIDLKKFSRPGVSKPLWDEIIDVQKKRNQIIHQANVVTSDESHHAIAVATSVLEELFPSVITKIGFHIHENGRVCNDWKCKHKELIEELKLKGIFKESQKK
ncbi:MAG: hypothetical protein NT022_02820 [Deltaproteobacteria bacterium]|nr:hypothetical protein [Deltaproteobacteria bacterium]